MHILEKQLSQSRIDESSDLGTFVSGADTGFKGGGGARFLGTKKFIIRYKKSRRRAGEIFFDLKDSKRVKINDLRLKN